MRRRTIGFLAFAAVVVAACVRLGFWQLSRFNERLEESRGLMRRFDAPRGALDVVLEDTAVAAYRRVTVAGRFDYDREIVLVARGRQGSPGVHLVTPLLLGVGDTAILVNRGWVYAADGLSVDSAAWREEGAASTVDGFLLPFPSATGPVDMPGRARHARRLARDSLAARFPYPIAPLLLVREERPDGEGEEQPNAAPRPARLEPPLPNTGSHRSYAIQWFAFAAIGAAGMLAVVLRSRVT